MLLLCTIYINKCIFSFVKGKGNINIFGGVRDIKYYVFSRFFASFIMIYFL